MAAPDKSSRQAFVAAMVASVGLDPRKDVDLDQPCTAGRLDAAVRAGPDRCLRGRLRARAARSCGRAKVGRVLINTLTDRPWSRYFCCLVAGNREIRSKIARSRRALRAILKGHRSMREPARKRRSAHDRQGVATNYDYVLQSVQEIGYRKVARVRGRGHDALLEPALTRGRHRQIGPQQAARPRHRWRFIKLSSKKELKA